MGKLVHGGRVYANVNHSNYPIANSMVFDGSTYFELPISMTSDHKITVVFEATTAAQNDSAIWATADNACYLVIYNNQWYVTQGTGIDAHFGSADTNEHTLVYNDGNGHTLFDGQVVANCTPRNSAHYKLGVRNVNKFIGKIKSFRVESISTGDLIFEVLPSTSNKILMYGNIDNMVTE